MHRVWLWIGRLIILGHTIRCSVGRTRSTGSMQIGSAAGVGQSRDGSGVYRVGHVRVSCTPLREGQMATVTSYELRKLPQDIVIEVEFHLSREFRVRRWIATRLIWLAAWVLGCGMEVRDDE